MPSPLVAAGAVAALLGAVAACGGGSSDEACGPIDREALDPGFLVHVLGTDEEPEYDSDPPTSGPHQPSPPAAGAVTRPLARPVQVGILERGDVLIQHLPDLPDGEVAVIRQLAGDGVVVAPNPDLPAPVVATAWTYKRTCSAVDITALEEFVVERAGKGPEG